MPQEIASCLFCRASNAQRWYTHHSKLDQRAYDVLRCRACESAFVFPPPQPEYLSDFYKSALNSHGGSFDAAKIKHHYEQILANEQAYPNSTLDAQRLVEKACRLAPGTKFLDIGAGYGFFTRAAAKAGFECTAIEPGPNNAAVFELMNGFRPLEASLDDGFSAAHEQAYDVILMSQVLEHIPNPAQAVRNLQRMLRPKGVCVIAVPHFGSYVSKLQGKRDMFITPPEHVNFFTLHGLRSLFDANGFRCAEVYTISRYDRNKLRRKLKVRPIADSAYGVLRRFMTVSDARGRGMFINALFVKDQGGDS